MQYMDIVWRSFRISWRHKYLWLIALFSGEGGAAGGSFSGGGGGGGGGGGTVGGSGQVNGQVDTTAIQDQITRFLTDYAGLILVAFVAWVLLVVIFFLVAAICEGATIRASAEHDADRPWGLGLAWRAGLHTLWPIVRFRLILFALGLPVLFLVIGLLVGTVLAIVNQNGGAVAPLILLGVVLVVAGIPYAIYLFFLDRLGSRTLVLEQIGARASIARGHRLLFKRFGRTLIVWLLSIAVGIAVGIVTGIAFTVLFLPLFIIGAFSTHNSGAIVALFVVGGLLLFAISLVVGGFVSAQSSTYWTLAFRRLDLDPVPPTPPPPPTFQPS
jgi:hypothetical protein